MYSEKAAEISFVVREHNFGDVKAGQIVTHPFEFINTGNAPLVLADVRVTCGCTVINWPRQPIAPGEKGTIVVQFNSADRIGPQNKIVTVLSNAKNEIERLLIRANVVP
ncbi:MAG: DUF1573 domain-containing protein [Cytophagales bacterium]|nr:DUF1573 domain-containing protein [Cytophagales bacterium]